MGVLIDVKNDNSNNQYSFDLTYLYSLMLQNMSKE